MENQVQKQEASIKGLMSNDLVKNKFAEILGKNAPAFISSVTTLATTTALKDCEPKSVLNCAIVAASLNLQVNPSLGFAAIVPYKSKNGLIAQFQIMWKGLWQLAMRSGQFENINVSKVFEGELKSEDRLTGLLDFSGEKKSEKIIGYVAFFKLVNGFQKSFYMTIEQINAHAKKYSKTFNSEYGAWKTNYESMCEKTVLKLLLSKYAPLSVDMQMAVEADQSVITTNDETLDITAFDYIDNDSEVVIEDDVKANRKTQPKNELFNEDGTKK